MDELQTFQNSEFGEIRTLMIDGEPWFIGKDIAKALGYGTGKSLNNAVANHVDEEDKGVTEMMTPGGKQNLVTVNESGLYSLIFSSKLPAAKDFKRWVTSEVLPSIRKTGRYDTEDKSDEEEEKIIPQKTMWTVTRNGVDVQYFFRREDMLEYMELVRKHRSLMNPQVVLHMAQKEYSEKDKCMLSKEVLIFRCENNYCDMFLIEER